MAQHALKNDLNLLKTLFVLFEERNIKATAARLFISPSAVSKSLGRLRQLFDDPLFVRRNGELVPSQRAIDIEPTIQQIFTQIESCLLATEFNPATLNGRVRIAAPELFSFALMPKLLLRLRNAAPHLILESQHLDDNYQRMLAIGKLDFAVSIEQPHATGYSATSLYSARPVYWGRKNHPLTAKKRISLNDIFAYPQIAFRTQNISQDDIRIILKKLTTSGVAEKSINTIFDTSHLLIAIDVLMKTDTLMLAPDYISLLPAFHDSLVAYPVEHIPAFDQFNMNLSLIQHNRTFESQLHLWIANQISDIFSAEIKTTGH